MPSSPATLARPQVLPSPSCFSLALLPVLYPTSLTHTLTQIDPSNLSSPDCLAPHAQKADMLKGQDPQGIPWSNLDTSRIEYRKSRLLNYLNYENLPTEQRQASAGELEAEISAHAVSADHQFYEFENNERQLRSSIVHFQLRNLVWATSPHDVFVTHVNEIAHYSYHTEKITPVLSLEGLQLCLGRVQISTMAVQDSLCIAGSFYGDIVCIRVASDLEAAEGKSECCGELLFCDRCASP